MNKISKENVFENPTNSTYKELEQTELWKIVSKSIVDLEANKDIIVTTNKDYVIGYICKMITKTKNIF